MATVLSRLQILLHANTANYRRDIKQATDQTKADLQSVSTAAVASSKKIDTAFKSLLNVKNAIAGIGMAAFASSVISTADNMQDLASKVRVSTSNAEEYAAVLQRLRDLSRENAASYAATVGLYADSRRALKELGKSQEQTILFTDNLTKAMRVGGGEAQAQAAALTQLGQALVSGVLRGEEFNSVATQAPILLELLAKELGTTSGAMRGLAADGVLTADVIYNAITKATDVLDEKLALMPVTVSQALGVFRDQYAIFIDDLINQNSLIGTTLAQVVLIAADNFATLAKAGMALGAIWAANAVAGSGLAASLMGVVGAQVAATRATVTNALSTKGQIAAINTLNTNLMLLRLTKANYIAITKEAIAGTIAYGRSLVSLAGSFKLSTAAAAVHNRTLAAGALAKRGATAAAILATNATSKLGGAFKSVASIVTKHPFLILAGVLTAIVVKTEGLQGAMNSLGEALSVVGLMAADMVTLIVDGMGWAWDTTSEFLTNLIGGSDTATAASSGYFADLFAGTEGGFVGLIQVAASVFDNMLSAAIAFASMTWTNLNELVTSVKNAFRAMGNVVISIFEGMVNGGIDRINILIEAVNTLKRGIAGVKDFFGFSGDYTPVQTVGRANFGRLQYEDTNYVGYSETRAGINVTAARSYVDGVVARSKEAGAAADAAAGSLGQMGTAATAAGNAADKAGKKTGNAANGAKDKIEKTKEEVDKLGQAFRDVMSDLERSLALLGTYTEFEKWRYDLNDITNELYKLDEAQKNAIKSQAVRLDARTVFEDFKQERIELENQIALAVAESDIQREILAISQEYNRELEKYNVLKTEGYETDYQVVKQTLEARKILATQVAYISAYAEIVEGLKGEDQQRLDTLREQLSVLSQIEALGEDVADARRGLLEGIALTEYESIYGTDNGPMADLYKVEDAAAEAFEEYSKQISALEQLRDENLIQEEAYQARLLEIQTEYAKKRGTIETDLAKAHDAIIASQLTSAQAIFSGLGDAAKDFMGEQSRTYKALFALQQSFVMASAGINMYKAYSDAMAEGATMAEKLTAAATVVMEFNRIITAAKAVTLDLPGYKTGGYTGDGSTYAPAGVVHGKEFVVHAEATRKHRPELEAMNNGTFKGGGTTVNVNVNVSSDGSRASAESDKQVGRNFGQAIVAAVKQQIIKEQRQGGLLYG